MGKYLELFRGEVGDLTEKTKLENKPYVAYSTKLDKVTYTVVPAKDPVVEGPANNEIWYTSSDGNIVNPYNTDVFGANIVSNTYENGKGVITFDGEVTSIGDYAFEGCSVLTITIPNSVTSIGYGAFRYCSSLTSITIPNSVTTIETFAFNYCSGLTSITIPNSVTSIGNYAFAYCSGLISIVVAEGNPVYDSRENCNAIIRTELNELIAGCRNTIIPNSVTSIGVSAFCNCTGLTSITIPNSVTRIGEEAFSDCSSLTSITIPESVTSIGNYAFNGCSSLTSITIPDSVTSIEPYAFSLCSSLTSVTFEGTMEEWNAVSKGSDWNYNVPATVVHCVDGDLPI